MPDGRRRLRKTEQQEVDRVVAPALERALPLLHALERLAMHEVVAAAPPGLAWLAFREFLNRMGSELATEIELQIGMASR